MTVSLLCTSSFFTLVFNFNILFYSYLSFPPIALLILGKEYVSKGVSVRAGLTDLLDRVGMQSGMYGSDPNNIYGQTGGEGGTPTSSGSISYIPNNFCSLSFTSIIQFLFFRLFLVYNCYYKQAILQELNFGYFLTLLYFD